MRKIGLYICICCLLAPLQAANTIEIPLEMSVVKFMQQDNPTGSTPDPTDPNQFRVTLTGNMLTVHTQKDFASFVVVRSDFCEKSKEDYFYHLSFDSVSCPITRPGRYAIHIGYWNTDFTAWFDVKSVIISDFNGKIYDAATPYSYLPPGMYIIYLKTNIGTTSIKILRL